VNGGHRSETRGEVYDGATSRPGAVLRVGIAITDVSMMWIIPTKVLLALAGFKPGGHPCKLGITTPPCHPIRTQIVLLIVLFIGLALIRWASSR
jgi:hypothetical protein